MDLDANGQSGGLSLGYNKHSIKLCNYWRCPRYIGADMFSYDLGVEVQTINVYGSCKHKLAFWDHLLSS